MEMLDDGDTYSDAFMKVLFQMNNTDKYANQGYVNRINTCVTNLLCNSSYSFDQFFADIDEIREELYAEERAVNMVEWI